MRETVPFRSLRKRLKLRFQSILDSRPERDVPPVFSKGGEEIPSLAGSLPVPEGKLLAWRGTEALVFSSENRGVFEESIADLLEKASFRDRISRETAFSSLLDCAFAVCVRGTSVPQAIDELVDGLLRVSERVTFVTPLYGLVPSEGELEIGGFRILASRNPEARALIESADFGGAGGPFDSPENRSRIAEVIAAYRAHSIAITTVVAKPGRALEVARDRLDYVLGALRFLTCDARYRHRVCK